MRIIRGTIKDAIASLQKLIRCTVLGLSDEQIDQAELFNLYGISSVPVDGAECLAVQFGHRTIVFAGADRNIAKSMDKGDVALNTSMDQFIILKSQGLGGIEIRTGGNVTVFATQIKLGEGDVTQGGIPLVSVIDGVVTPKCACSYMGMHTQGSASVLARNG
jgi:phage gp45-like